MEYRILGNSTLKVSVVGLGTDTFGVGADEKIARAIVDQALDVGVNYIDTADVYGGRLSEQFVGNAVKGKRARVIIATKFGASLSEDGKEFTHLEGRGTRDYIMKAVDASLKRLDTDYIDLYQFHMPDPKTPVEDTLRALDELTRSGKVRYVGCSNIAAWELCEALWVSQVAKLVSFVSIQPKYNLLDRRIEDELVPCCKAYNIGIIPWFPLAAGFLTGKYRRGQPFPPGTRFSNKPVFYKQFISDANFDMLDKLEAFARERGYNVAELAISWLVSQPFISTVIAGATKTEQVSANVAAANWKLTAADMANLDKAVGHRPYAFNPAAPRYYRTPQSFGAVHL